MKALSIVLVPILVVGFLVIAPKIKRANNRYLLQHKLGLPQRVEMYAPEIARQVKEYRGNRLILKNGCEIILGHGGLKEKLQAAKKILKNEKNVKVIDFSVPGYVAVKNGREK